MFKQRDKSKKKKKKKNSANRVNSLSFIFVTPAEP